MLIQHRQYIALIDEIQYLKKDNSLLRQENSLISQQLLKAREQIQQLSQHHLKNLNLIQKLHGKTILHQTDNTKHIVSRIKEQGNQTKEFLDKKFKVLENLTCNEAKESELKMAKSKIDLYELNDFVNKVRTIYKEVQSPQTHQMKKLSLPELTKWIKGLAMVCLTQQRLGLSQSISTTNIKKHGAKSSKLKQNKSVLNCSKSRQKSKIY